MCDFILQNKKIYRIERIFDIYRQKSLWMQCINQQYRSDNVRMCAEYSDRMK